MPRREPPPGPWLPLISWLLLLILVAAIVYVALT